MRTKIVVAFAAVLALLVVGVVGYVALVGVQVSPSKSTLTGRWGTDDHVTTLDLNADGTFTTIGLSQCMGPLHYTVPDAAGAGIDYSVSVDRGEGTWSYGPDPEEPGVDALTMQFRSPKVFAVSWSVSQVTWQFHAKEVGVHGAGTDVPDLTPGRSCELASR
jgi:hypothetical protein